MMEDPPKIFMEEFTRHQSASIAQTQLSSHICGKKQSSFGAQANVSCFLDGYLRYNQIRICLQDQEKTIFTRLYGTFVRLGGYHLD